MNAVAAGPVHRELPPGAAAAPAPALTPAAAPRRLRACPRHTCVANSLVISVGPLPGPQRRHTSRSSIRRVILLLFWDQ